MKSEKFQTNLIIFQLTRTTKLHSITMPTTTRRVTINTTVEVHKILSIYDYTASEISASWYDEQDMDKISQRCFKILQKYESGVSNKKYCIRGLEGHSRLAFISKQNNRTDAYSAVFEEQQRQYQNEETDIQAISDVYKRSTLSSQMWAQVVGARDERAVEAYLYEVEDEEDVAAPPVLESTNSKVLTPECGIKRRVSAPKAAYSPSARAA